MNRIDLGQSLQILTNIGVIAAIVFLGLNMRQDQSQPEETLPQITNEMSVIPEEYIDVYALKCPSSYDDETRRFRSENYWMLQRAHDEETVSVVSRPDRDTGTWRIDVDTLNNKMIDTPDYYEWESLNYSGNYYILNRKDLTMERQRTNRDTINSPCVLIDPNEARDAVEQRYQLRLEGNRI
jgi:hypothetical protein